MIDCPYCGNPTDFLLPAQVAQLLKVPVQTVRRWIREGRLPAEKTNVRGREIWKVPTSVIIPLLQGKK
jgi:excisionase family DNA binding protein